MGYKNISFSTDSCNKLIRKKFFCGSQKTGCDVVSQSSVFPMVNNL